MHDVPNLIFVLHDVLVVIGFEFIQVINLTLQHLQSLPERLKICGRDMNVADDVIAQGHALLLRLFKLLSSVCRMIWLFSFSARSYVDERSYATWMSKSDIEVQKAYLPQLPFCTHRGGALTASQTSVPRNRPERETVRVRNQEKPREVEHTRICHWFPMRWWKPEAPCILVEVS